MFKSPLLHRGRGFRGGLWLLFLLACQPEPQQTSSKSPTVASNDFDKTTLIDKDYLIDAQHSYIGFKIKYFGFSPVRGRFDEFDGTAFYDPENKFLSVSLLIEVSSINTGNEQRDNDLTQTEEWFAAEQYPLIRFQSKETIFREDGGFDLVGEFSMKDSTHELTIPFSPPTEISRDWAGNEQVDFSGRITINRLNYGVKGDEFWSTVMENGLTQLSDEVEIEIDIHARRADYRRRYADLEADDNRKAVIDEIEAIGLESGLALIDEIQGGEKRLSSGNFSTIGYYFNTIGKSEIGEEIFLKKAESYPNSRVTANQLGISYLLSGKMEEARTSFNKALEAKSDDSRAMEYLRNFW